MKTLEDICICCARGFHWECINEDMCCCPPSPDINNTSATEIEPTGSSKLGLFTDEQVEVLNEVLEPVVNRVAEEAEEIVKRPVGRPRKADDEITVSAGRKRAAELYTSELKELEWCEWRNRAECGGGLKPILGCIAGKPKHIHHGPIKNTAHNERENISLICVDCHINWHNANDPIYDESLYSTLPKSDREMTEEEIKKVVFQGRFEK